jgi:hypothetical protein
MTVKEIKKLQSGDEVFVKDHADGRRSRHYTVNHIDVFDDIVQLLASDGSYVECWPEEVA